MYLQINALGDYKKKYDPFARLLALKRGVGVCSVVGVVSGFYGTCIVEGGDQRRDDLYACKVLTEIESVIYYFSSNFYFLADEVLREVAGD